MAMVPEKRHRAPRRRAIPATMLGLPTREQHLWSQLMQVLHDIARDKIVKESGHAA